MKWRLTGTPAQIALAQGALDDIKFPWAVLNISWMPELGWADLNSGYSARAQQTIAEKARGHKGEFSPDHEGPPEPLNGELEGRRFTYAVFYPGSARIYIDHRLESYPALARAAVAAEIAHAVDEFLPLTEAQRNQIIDLLGGGLTWWEKENYSTEYWTLAGEHFMPLFCDAYSEIPFGDVSSFERDPNLVNPDDIVRIVGIQRTDYVAPTPAPPPPEEPVIQPEEEIVPVEPPAPPPEQEHIHTYIVLGKSKIAHRPSHYDETPRKNMLTLVAANIPEGYRACKVCKPH